jgi:hypothetical protein
MVDKHFKHEECYIVRAILVTLALSFRKAHAITQHHAHLSELICLNPLSPLRVLLEIGVALFGLGITTPLIFRCLAGHTLALPEMPVPMDMCMREGSGITLRTRKPYNISFLGESSAQ